MSTYRELNERFSLERNQVIAIYANCFFSALVFLVLVILAATLTPVAQDASVLIKDAGLTLKDFSIIIPEAQNTTRILGHMVPEITQGMHILRQLCLQDPECHL
jgi:hypothetical protein